METWRVLDHPADLAIEGRGDTPEGAYRALIEGLLAEIGPGLEGPGDSAEIAAEGLDREECLVSALNELLYRVNVRSEWFSEPRVLELGETRVRLGVRCAPRPADQPLETEIKAATYHGLELAPDPGGGWRMRVIFDV